MCFLPSPSFATERLILEAKRKIKWNGPTVNLCARWEVPHYFVYVNVGEQKYREISGYEIARWPEEMRCKFFIGGAKAMLRGPIVIEFYTWKSQLKCKVTFSIKRVNRRNREC